MRFATFVAAAAGMTLTGMASAATIPVYSNTVGGDLFTNAGGSGQGQGVGSSGFYYNNVRNSGNVGIRGNYARSGNGSAFLETTVGPGGASSKADFELLATGTDVGGNYYAASSFGTLGSLTSLKYEWYRDSVSTNSTGQHAVIRILVDADGNLGTTGDRGGLVFERAYNGGGAVPTNTWVSENLFAYGAGSGANLWTFGAGMAFAANGYGVDLTDWKSGTGTIGAGSLILGFSMGVGSGWGPHKGAVDNLTVGFNGAEDTYNFEVQESQLIPLPSAGGMALAGLGILGARRRRAG